MTTKENQRELIVEIMKADEQSGLYDEPMMRKTAVDWMFDQLWDETKDKFIWHSILIQAKEIEEHEIAKAHTAGFLAGDNNVYKGGYVYYQETYKK